MGEFKIVIISGFELLTIIVTFIVGFLTAIASKIVIIWIYRPKLEISDRPIKVTSTAGLEILNNVDGVISVIEQKVKIYAYRIKVLNKGKTAAKNVCGTIEFVKNPTERRICWYEGNVPSITINAGDHSFIDVHGVIMQGNKFTNEICFPTENGWNGLVKKHIDKDLIIKLRVTAENAEAKRKSFRINSMNNCELESIN